MKKSLAMLTLLLVTPAIAQNTPPLPDAELYEIWQSCIQHYEPLPPPSPQASSAGRGPQPTKFLPGWESCAAVRDERAKRVSADAEQSRKKRLEDAVQRLNLPK